MENKTKLIVAVAAVLALGVSACAGGPPPATSLFSFEKKPREVTGAEMGDKTGKVCKSQVLGFLTFGESGYYKAAKDGNITTISAVSDSWTQILPAIYTKHCTIVSGS